MAEQVLKPRIVLFDGECNLCNHSVQFIIQRDPDSQFNFCSLQSETGQELLKKHQLPAELQSLVLVQNERAYIRSSGALRIARRLQGAWPLMFLFWIVPKPLRDLVYNYVAANRYKWFGKQESCWIPTPELQARFIDQ